MSQSGTYFKTSGFPTIPTNFVTDSGTAVPLANTININGAQTSANNNNGIETTGSGNTVDILLTNRVTGQVTTSGATPTAIATFTFGALQVGATFECMITAIKTSNGQVASWVLLASAKSSGAAATVVGSAINIDFKDTDLVTANVTFTASGNTVSVNAVGVAATTIDWDALINYRQVS